MRSRIILPALGIIAGSFGIAIGALRIFDNYRRQKIIMDLNLTKNAIEKIREYPNLMDLLGGSFEVGSVNLHDGWTKIESDKLQVRVPINGKNQAAHLFGFARKSSFDGRPELVKVEMTFDKIKGKKVILMDISDTESNHK